MNSLRSIHIPYERIVVWAGPPIHVIAGAAAAWLATRIGLFHSLGLSQTSLGHGLSVGLTWALTTLVAYAAQHKWLDNLARYWFKPAGPVPALNSPTLTTSNALAGPLTIAQQPSSPEAPGVTDEDDDELDDGPPSVLASAPVERVDGAAAQPDVAGSAVAVEPAALSAGAAQHMSLSTHGAQLIESFEGYSYQAYWDPYGHVWTVGYGETSGVGPGSTMTRQQAQQDLERRVAADYAPSILALGVPLTQNQFDALCSFVWNLGPGAMSWDVGRYLRARDYTAAGHAMLVYDRAGGIVLAGLTRRRQAEVALFFDPEPRPANPLDIFPTNGPDGDERKLVEQADGALKHPGRHRAYLKHVLYPHLKRDRDRLSRVSRFEAPHYTKRREHADWQTDRRGARWQGLDARMRKIDRL